MEIGQPAECTQLMRVVFTPPTAAQSIAFTAEMRSTRPMLEAAHHNQNVKGIICILISLVFFSIMDAVMKYLTADYTALQVAFIRAVSSLPLLMLVIPVLGGYRSLRTQRFKMHMVRSLLGVLMLTLVIFCLSRLSLADAYAIFFTAPLFITVLSIPMLGEQVGRHRWLAIVIGFIGVLVILKPSGEGFVDIGGLAGLLGAFCYALVAIFTRQLSDTETVASLTLYFLVTLAIVAGVLSIPVWQPIDWSQWPVFLLMGVSGAVGMVLLAFAFRYAVASVIAPFDYTAMIWAILIGYWVWGDLPSVRLYLGMGIIIGAGLYVIYREREHATAVHPEH